MNSIDARIKRLQARLPRHPVRKIHWRPKPPDTTPEWQRPEPKIPRGATINADGDLVRPMGDK